jgi:hypothetical protein
MATKFRLPIRIVKSKPTCGTVAGAVAGRTTILQALNEYKGQHIVMLQVESPRRAQTYIIMQLNTKFPLMNNINFFGAWSC